LRECGKIGARGFDEAMRVTRPGIYEYQVVAACDFIYQDAGQANPALLRDCRVGWTRDWDWHYNANNHLLKSGDVILLDYAPELNYYTTDITRTWPVEGKFTTSSWKCITVSRRHQKKSLLQWNQGVYLDSLTKFKKMFSRNMVLKNLPLTGWSLCRDGCSWRRSAW